MTNTERLEYLFRLLETIRVGNVGSYLTIPTLDAIAAELNLKGK